jgi:hypothetical protein
MCALSFTLQLGTAESLIISFFLVVSLIGVILIARPTALFGNAQVGEEDPTSVDSAEKGAPRDRLIAVGYVLTFNL